MSAIVLRPACVLFVSALFLAGAAEAGSPRLALAPGDRAPVLRGNLPDGSSTTVDYGSNKLTLVNFWATWCEPCKNEMPDLQRLWESHSEEGFEVVGPFRDKADNKAIRKFCDDLGVGYRVIRLQDKVVASWGGSGVLPLTFLVDAEGKILRRYVGATPEQVEGLVQDVGNVLQNRPLGPLVIPEAPAVADSDAIKAAQEN